MADGARRDFEASYRDGTAPWDVGAPQPDIVRLAEEGEIVGDVLDVGCGTGENALHLAALGRAAVGVDAAPTAIARAREKAAARGLDDGLHVRQVVCHHHKASVQILRKLVGTGKPVISDDGLVRNDPDIGLSGGCDQHVLGDRIEEDVEGFMGDADRVDDITLIVVKVL